MDTNTHAPIQAASALTTVKPEFIRLPKSGTRCPHTGLSRSKMNQLVLPCKENDFKPPVESKCDRKRGTIRGTRFIVFDSLIGYLNGLDSGGKTYEG
jgi:hypothetical protein